MTTATRPGMCRVAARGLAAASGSLAMAGCLAAEPPPFVWPPLAPEPAPVAGAVPAIGDRLTLADALAVARAGAPRLLAARAREGIAAGRLRSARGYPTGSRVELEGAVTPDGDEWDARLAVGHRFELGGQRAWRVRRAAAGVAGAQAGIADATRELLADVEAAFLTAVATEAALGVARETEEVAGALLASAEARRAGGDLTETDLNLVRLEAVRAQRGVREGASARNRARAGLLGLLGQDDRPGLLLEGTLAGAGDPPEVPELLRRALGHRPDLAVLVATEAEADAEAGLAAADRWPALDATLGFGFERAELRGLRDTDPTVSASIELELPGLWNAGAGEIATARAAAAAARAERAALARAITVAVIDARRAWATARASAEQVEREAVPLALANLALARRAFEAGEGDTLGVLRARDEAARARREALDARLAEALARAELGRLTGGEPRP